MNITNFRYKTDGAGIDANASSRVKRKSEEVFLNAMLEKLYSYIFSARQMGKTSLIFNMIKELEALGNKCAYLQLAEKASSPEQWYKNMIRRLVKKFKLLSNEELDSWLNKKKSFSMSTYIEAIDEIILERIKPNTNIYIFYDEINIAEELPYPIDEYWIGIKKIFQKRLEDDRYQRLTFIFSGVTTPGDLMKNKSYVPFDIGKVFKLSGFTLEEAKPLLEGFRKDKIDTPILLLKEIIDCTGGQPFLVQQFCEHIQVREYFVPRGEEKKCIEKIASFYCKNWIDRECDDPPHFRNIDTIVREKIENSKDLDIINYLETYEKILRANGDGFDIKQSNKKNCQKLFAWGLIKLEGGKARVFSPLYKRIFSLEWVKEHINSRYWSEKIERWSALKKLSHAKAEVLAKGEELEELNRWRSGKTLTKEQEEYIDACNLESSLRKFKQIKTTIFLLSALFVSFVPFIAFDLEFVIKNKEFGSGDAVSNQYNRAGHFSDTCDRISMKKIEKDFILFADCYTSDGRVLPTDYNLNDNISNIDGRLTWSSVGDYVKSCKNHQLKTTNNIFVDNRDTYLVGDCLTLDGSWNLTQLNLDERIENKEGTL